MEVVVVVTLVLDEMVISCQLEDYFLKETRHFVDTLEISGLKGPDREQACLQEDDGVVCLGFPIELLHFSRGFRPTNCFQAIGDLCK